MDDILPNERFPDAVSVCHFSGKNATFETVPNFQYLLRQKVAHARRRASGGRRRRTSRINEISVNNGEVNDEDLVFEDIDTGKKAEEIKARLSTIKLKMATSKMPRKESRK